MKTQKRNNIYKSALIKQQYKFLINLKTQNKILVAN